MPNIEVDAPGTIQLLMGNEAIARGALEAGVGFAAAYPGTPSSEIIGSLAAIAKETGIYAEWSTNEIVALEAAAAASFAGIRAICAMKHNGVNVALDFLANLAVSGVGKGGLVLVVCDDPGALSSSNEQDTRIIPKWLDIPLLEPASFQEAKDMTKWLFDLSEELGTICMLRSVTRIAHARGVVRLGELTPVRRKAHFNDTYDLRNPKIAKFSTTPGALRHAALHSKLGKCREKFETSPFNLYSGPSKIELLIITSGSGWLYSQDALKMLGLGDKVGILKLGTLWPLPEEFIKRNLGVFPDVLFVEEIDPFLERSIMELTASGPFAGHRLTFYGKRSGHIPAFGELNPDLVIQALSAIMNIPYQPRDVEYARKAEEAARKYVSDRSMAFCAGCSHRASFWAVKNALALDGRNGIVTGDIGCYVMGLRATGFYQMRTHQCMGASVGIASGLGKLEKYGFDQPVIAAVGDSTFFHAAIPALINAIYNKSNFILMILDNGTTAMTNFQPHPGSGINAMGETTEAVRIEDLCHSLGVPVEICDPFELKETTEMLLRRMREGQGVRVVIMRRECELVRRRREGRSPYQVWVDSRKCVGEGCGCDRFCTRVFRCPGLVWDAETGKAVIEKVLCCGCGVCTNVCMQRAILKEAI